jgi:hypothetical protein
MGHFLTQLERIASRQWHVLTLAQLHEAGLSKKQIRTMVERRQLHRRHRGVYAYGHPDIPWQGAFLAAQLACGPTAYLTGDAALALHGLRRPYTGRIELTVPGGGLTRRADPMASPQLEVHRTTVLPTPDELRTSGPLRYAAIPRVLLELAARGASERHLGDLITRAVRAGKLDHGHMQRALDRHRGRPGTPALTAAYAYYLPRHRSASTLEDAFDAAIARRPSIPEPERNTHITAAGIAWEIDRYFPEEGVAVELDHRQYHDAKADRERDNRKDHALQAIGLAVMRISDTRWELDREGALDDLEALLRARTGWGRSAPPR